MTIPRRVAWGLFGLVVGLAAGSFVSCRWGCPDVVPPTVGRYPIVDADDPDLVGGTLTITDHFYRVVGGKNGRLFRISYEQDGHAVDLDYEWW